MSKPLCWIFIAVGAFTLICCIFNFDWYFNGRKAQRFVDAIGRTAARIIYSVIGVILIIIGIAFLV